MVCFASSSSSASAASARRRVSVVVACGMVACVSGVAMNEGSSSRRTARRSEALPWMAAPSAPWMDGSMVGDCGFDPLGLAASPALLSFYREAEIKHSRLAMLAAVGWPMSELWDRPLASVVHTSDRLVDGGLAPSVLNGGLDGVSPLFWGASLGLAAAFEMYAVSNMLRSTREGRELAEPGDLAFDPLGFLPTERLRKKRMCLAELKHGRIAMIAVVGFAAQEFVLGTPVVEHSFGFFHPFWAAFF